MNRPKLKKGHSAYYKQFLVYIQIVIDDDICLVDHLGFFKIVPLSELKHPHPESEDKHRYPEEFPEFHKPSIPIPYIHTDFGLRPFHGDY